ncbi:MAG: UDP-N-acetylmuramate:L-alanyl-gamma-D-glutamyl-meso-diaminopimelate ligase, partial [Terriglobales bacterium]
VVIADVFRPEAIPEGQRLSVAAVVEGIVRAGKSARALADADAIVAAIAPELRSGDVVAIFSNGGFGDIYVKLPRRLESHSEVAAQA